MLTESRKQDIHQMLMFGDWNRERIGKYYADTHHGRSKEDLQAILKYVWTCKASDYTISEEMAAALRKPGNKPTIPVQSLPKH